MTSAHVCLTFVTSWLFTPPWPLHRSQVIQDFLGTLGILGFSNLNLSIFQHHCKESSAWSPPPGGRGMTAEVREDGSWVSLCSFPKENKTTMSPSMPSPHSCHGECRHVCPLTIFPALYPVSYPTPHLHPPFLSFLSAVSLQDSSQGITYLLMSTTAVRREEFSFRLPWRFQLVFWHGWRVTSVCWKPRVQVKTGSCFHHRFFCIYYSY